MGKFRMPDGSLIEIPGSKVSKSQAAKPAVPPATRPSLAELERLVQAEVAKSVEKAEVRERMAKAVALEDQARSWRQRALDGRVSGMDRELREHLVRKAEAAETAAERLRGGETVSAADQAKAEMHEVQAAECDRKAADATDNGVRGYWRDKAREARTLAALARGEKADPSGDRRQRGR